MKVLDRLPVYDEPTLVDVQGEPLQIWRNQIIIWVSIREAVRPFPALLDTGHSHHFSIAQSRFRRWCGADLRQIGRSKIGKETVPQFETILYLHRNVRGQRRLDGKVFPLTLDQGIAIIPDVSPVAPRLPLLGLRAIIGNELRLLIDGKRREVTLKTAGWW